MKQLFAVAVMSISAVAAHASAKGFDLQCASESHNVRKGKRIDLHFTTFYSFDAGRRTWCNNKCDDPHSYVKGSPEWTLFDQPPHVYRVFFDPKLNHIRNETNDGGHRESWTETCRRITFTGIRPKVDRDR